MENHSSRYYLCHFIRNSNDLYFKGFFAESEASTLFETKCQVVKNPIVKNRFLDKIFPMNKSKILILGIGNQLMTDDGVGGQAVLRLAEETKQLPGVSCLDGGTLGHLLVGYIEESDNLIVVDAAQMNAQPGEVRVFENQAMDDFLTTNPNRSVHEVGLSDLMDMALLGGHLPKHRALIAVQPFDTDWGVELSAPVSQSLPLVCEHAMKLIEGWSV